LYYLVPLINFDRYIFWWGRKALHSEVGITTKKGKAFNKKLCGLPLAQMVPPGESSRKYSQFKNRNRIG